MNKRLLTVAAFALAGCVTVVAQDKKKEFKMPTGYAGITHEMSEFYEPVPPVVTPGTDLKGGGFTAPSDAICRMLAFTANLTARIFPLGRA